MADMTTVERPVEKRAKQVAEKAKQRMEEVKPEVESVMKRIEHYSPPVFLGLTLASILTSMGLYVRKYKDSALFVGLWAPTFLSLGLFYTLIGAGKTKK